MTELEQIAAGLLAQWTAQGNTGGGPIAVAALLDDLFPYRIARRFVAVDASEDYEALLLRLLSEEEDLVRVEPVDAADLARATTASRIPDLDVLQLLRGATVTISDRTIGRLKKAVAARPARTESVDHDAMTTSKAPAPAEAPPVAAATDTTECWSCDQPLPAGRAVKFCPFCGADQREPACPSCGAAVERTWHHCPDCGTRLRAA
jgi:predicted RNA-binding Zn-ribbon protein involved in translation (DUF1610 family)